MKIVLKSQKPMFKVEMSRDTFSLISNSLLTVVSRDCLVEEKDLNFLLDLNKFGLLPSLTFFIVKNNTLLILDLNEGKFKPSPRPLNKFYCQLEVNKEANKTSTKKPVIPVVKAPSINPDNESNDNVEQDIEPTEPVRNDNANEDNKTSKKDSFKVKKKG